MFDARGSVPGVILERWGTVIGVAVLMMLTATEDLRPSAELDVVAPPPA